MYTGLGKKRIRIAKYESLLGICESFWPTGSQYFWITANYF